MHVFVDLYDGIGMVAHAPLEFLGSRGFTLEVQPYTRRLECDHYAPQLGIRHEPPAGEFH
ncbi:hypothetical protein [Nocardia xishanensis]